ncbi:hypothetical protein [Paraburkholderia youngii]|uniref:hypothetical protein n=1 Tax=Paraburkholderia youngii TaxID=2782701 RepID=UPI003D252B07
MASSMRTVTISGQDYGKLWQIMQIKYMPSYVVGENYLSSFKLFERFGVGFVTGMTAGASGQEVISNLVNPFISSLTPPNSPNPIEIKLDVSVSQWRRRRWWRPEPTGHHPRPALLFWRRRRLERALARGSRRWRLLRLPAESAQGHHRQRHPGRRSEANAYRYRRQRCDCAKRVAQRRERLELLPDSRAAL